MTSWLSKSAVAALTGWTARHVERQAATGKIDSRFKPEAGSRKLEAARGTREYSVASLPADAQKRFLDLQLAAASRPQPPATSHQLPAMGVSPGPALRRIGTSANQPEGAEGAALQRGFFDHAPELADVHRVVLPPELEKQARERFAAIAPMVDFAAGKYRGSNQPELRSLNTLVDWLSAQRGISKPTLWRWYSRFKDHGYAALADQVRCDKGSSRFFSENPVLGEFVQKKYLAERLSFSAVHDALSRECGKRGLDVPDYKTVRIYLKLNIPKPLEVISREGERQYHERCEPYLVKRYDDKLSNDIWVSDHMIHDVWVRNDFFSAAPEDSAVRIWLTAIIDYRSRKALGYTWSLNPSSDTIATALRMALLKYGRPQMSFYVDNGKDFKKLGRVSEISPELSGALAKLEIAAQHCKPRWPQSKHIERWFGTLHSNFDAKFRPFYCGTSPKDRPEECDRAIADHKKLLKLDRAADSVMPLASEFLQMAACWIEQDYNSEHSHLGQGMDGDTPNAVFDRDYPVDSRRSLTAEEVRRLDFVFRNPIRRKVMEGGCVRLNNSRYEPADPASGAALFQLSDSDTEIIVACDPNNIGEAIATNLDGMYLGTLQASRLMTHGPISQEDVKRMEATRARLRRAMKDYVGGLVARSYSRGELSEVELLRERAGVGNVAARPLQRSRALPASTAIPSPVAAAPVGYDHVVKKFFELEEEE